MQSTINDVVHEVYARYLAAGPTTPPPAPAAGGGLNLPPIIPDMKNTPGIGGMQQAANSLAAYVIVGGIIAILLGALMVVLAPRLGFSQAKALGMGGIIGGFAVGGIVALSTTGVDTIYGWFQKSV